MSESARALLTDCLFIRHLRAQDRTDAIEKARLAYTQLLAPPTRVLGYLELSAQATEPHHKDNALWLAFTWACGDDATLMLAEIVAGMKRLVNVGPPRTLYTIPNATVWLVPRANEIRITK